MSFGSISGKEPLAELAIEFCRVHTRARQREQIGWPLLLLSRRIEAQEIFVTRRRYGRTPLNPNMPGVVVLDRRLIPVGGNETGKELRHKLSVRRGCAIVFNDYFTVLASEL